MTTFKMERMDYYWIGASSPQTSSVFLWWPMSMLEEQYDNTLRDKVEKNKSDHKSF